MTCPECGAQIGSDSAVCPACLMQIGLAGDAETMSSPAAVPASRPATPRLAPGQRFGPYRIERMLGRGGMGEVYEAEHVDNGRRLALKILNQALADDRDRARFVREGQLAASVTHPNVVYIFGAEEITGTPIITMELVAGGTLKDRVARDGPLAPADAVDAILDVISGLDAAQAAGILHRDIKPSNCFVDRDGTVKIGDFGLSISTMTRPAPDLTMAGSVQGTPQFASPEQLKGAPLDVRSDVYAVGATLYYLLTGRPPFEADDLMTLLARVATDTPASPRTRRRDVPKALAAVVLNCLAKDPAARLGSYAALARRLQPFGSRSREGTPAPLGLRFVSAFLDYLSFFAIVIVVGLLATAAVNLFSLPEPPEPAVPIVWIVLPFFVPYLALSEALAGGAIGKRVLGLRVARREGAGRLPLGRAFLRAGVYLVFLLLADGAMNLTRRIAEATIEFNFLADLVAMLLAPLAFLGMLALFFATARRTNGFEALHDRLSGSRVVQRAAPNASSATRPAMADAAPWALADYRIGPYRVVADPPTPPPAGLVLAFDEALRRSVWIARAEPDAPPVSTSRRDLTRRTRLRWLAGSRSADAWDAYEVAAGAPLTAAGRAPLTWREVRRMLAALTAEMRAGLADASLPPLGLDRVWVSPDGAVQLVEWPATGAPAADQAEAIGFLHASAVAALRSTEGVRLPLHARALLEDLRHGRVPSLEDVEQRLASTASQPVSVSVARRVIHLFLCSLFPAQMVLFTAMAALMFSPDSLFGQAAQNTRTQLFMASSGLLILMVVSVPLAVASRGGLLLRLLRIGVVDGDGREVSRRRAAARALAAWSPVLAWLLLIWFGPRIPDPAGNLPTSPTWVMATVAGLMTVFLAGVVWAAARPQRGIQDHLARTWLVPR